MQLPRLAANLVVDNALYTLILSVATMALASALFALFFFILRVVKRATKIPRVVAVVDQARRLLRVFYFLTLAAALLGAGGLFAVLTLRKDALVDQLQQVIDGFTIHTLVVILKFLGGVVVTVVGSMYLRRILHPLLARLEGRLVKIEVLTGQEERVQKAISTLKPLASVAAVFAAYEAGSAWLGLPDILDHFIGSVLRIVLVLNATRSVLLGSQLLTWSLERLGKSRFGETRYGRYYDSLRNMWPLAQRSFEAVAWIAAATIVVGELDVLSSVAHFGPTLIRVVGIFFVSRFLTELARVLVDEWFTKMEPGSHHEVEKRRRTLGVLILNLLRYGIFFVTLVFMFSAVGVDPTPFLAGAGIIGLAVGLGAKEMIGDMLQGFILMFEGRLNPGDYVKIGEAQGVIESITMRVTEVRDVGGRLHTIRNGNINTLTNFSRGWVNALVDVLVPHGTSLARVETALLAAGERLATELPNAVAGKTKVEGVTELNDHGFVVRTTTRVGPGQHGGVERRYRALIQAALAESAIDMAPPTFVMQTEGAGERKGDDDDDEPPRLGGEARAEGEG